jgi:hypothetical protein
LRRRELLAEEFEVLRQTEGHLPSRAHTHTQITTTYDQKIANTSLIAQTSKVNP